MTSIRDSFFISNKMSSVLEEMIARIDTLEEFEQTFSDEFLDNDDHIGNYLAELLWKYGCKASVVSTSAMLTHSYVGNIVNGKKKNPSRDALICICLTIGTTVEEVQYLLKYAGQAPLYVRRNMDRFILGYLSNQLSIDKERINRTIVRIPGSDNLVLIYNKLFEEEQLKEKAEVYEKRGYVMKPLATIPELDLTLYSRCLVCRMNADGTFASLEKEDFEKFIDYLAM